MSKNNSTEPWYKKGLRFQCTGCGKCCTGAPGYVWLTENDIERLATHLNLSREAFINQHCRYVGKRISLKERSISYSCIFLDGKRCTVYEARPIQCRTYPFWPQNVQSPRAWEEEQSWCEGINAPDSDLIPLETIRKKLAEKEND